MNNLFYGTRLFYDLLYFVTSMSPAYLLFLLQINQKFKQPFDWSIFNFQITIYSWCGISLVILILFSLLLKCLLRRQFQNGSGTPVTATDLRYFFKSNIAEANGNVISFLLGNILPAVLILEHSLAEAIAVFISLQFIIFILIKKSSDIFPNIMLLLLGVDLCKTKQGHYVFILAGDDHDALRVYQIGDAAKSKTYITAYKK